ncbi:MAG: hypothetical protein KAR57_02730 [Bacteroidales bacterium]|nr:hypothetical protein [Bacteroidales bacterium]
MTLLHKLFINPHNISSDYTKRFCFLNNIRSKYLTIFLILISAAFTFYDISVLQYTHDKTVFLIHFKTDIIFFVFSFIFTLYIYFNQVKSHKNILKHHKLVHGIIALFILTWSVIKSILLVKYNDGSYYLAAISILVCSILYIFPIAVYIGQIIFTFLLAVVVSFLFNFTIDNVINDLAFIAIILFLSLIISRYLFYLHIKIMYKELEILKYKKKV